MKIKKAQIIGLLFCCIIVFFGFSVNQASATRPVAIIDTPVKNLTVHTGDKVTFSGHGTDTDGNNIIEYQWHSGNTFDASTFFDGGNAKEFTKTFSTIGTETIYFRVKDDSGTWSATTTYPTDAPSVTITVKNVIPTAIITLPNYPIDEERIIVNIGDSIIFNGEGSDDGSIAQYQWHSGPAFDASTFFEGGGTKEFIKTFSTIGTETVYFRVKDDYGDWSKNAPFRTIVVVPKIIAACDSNGKVKIDWTSVSKNNILYSLRINDVSNGWNIPPSTPFSNDVILNKLTVPTYTHLGPINKKYQIWVYALMENEIDNLVNNQIKDFWNKPPVKEIISCATPAPVVSISALPTAISLAEKTRLTWTVNGNNITSCTASTISPEAGS
ncbi:MAG: hypothetical protein WA055_00450, partial [Candidatus Moraniibacteriota bacterium]